MREEGSIFHPNEILAKFILGEIRVGNGGGGYSSKFYQNAIVSSM